MKKLMVILSCILLTSCGGSSRDDKEYEIFGRFLNNDDTYTYYFEDSSWWKISDEITTTERFKVGDKFTLSINRVKP